MAIQDLARAVIGVTSRRLGDAACTIRDPEGLEAAFTGVFFAQYVDLQKQGDYDVASYSPALQCGIADVGNVRLASGRTLVDVDGQHYVLNYTKRPGNQDLVLVLHEAAE